LLWFAPGNAARASAPFHLPRENKSLHFLFDKVFEKAVDIVQNSCVKRVVGETSGRELFQVKAKRSSSSRRNRRSTGGEAQQDDYLVLPFHYCSCHAFQYEVINRGEMFLVRGEKTSVQTTARSRTTEPDCLTPAHATRTPCIPYLHPAFAAAACRDGRFFFLRCLCFDDGGAVQAHLGGENRKGAGNDDDGDSERRPPRTGAAQLLSCRSIC